MVSRNDSSQMDVVIEIPRGGFAKRNHAGYVSFISPLPCWFNYGSIPKYYGLDDDLLDAVVLGPRLPRGTHVRVKAHGAIGLSDHGDYDDKLICSEMPPGKFQRAAIILFFHLYAVFKWILNVTNGLHGRTACEGWGDVTTAISRARRRNNN